MTELPEDLQVRLDVLAARVDEIERCEDATQKATAAADAMADLRQIVEEAVMRGYEPPARPAGDRARLWAMDQRAQRLVRETERAQGRDPGA